MKNNFSLRPSPKVRKFFRKRAAARVRRVRLKKMVEEEGLSWEEAHDILRLEAEKKARKRAKEQKRAMVPKAEHQRRAQQAATRQENTGQGRDQQSVRKSAGRKARGGGLF